VAPMVMGEKNGRRAVTGPDLKSLASAHKLTFQGVEKSGPDLHLVLRRPTDAAGNV